MKRFAWLWVLAGVVVIGALGYWYSQRGTGAYRGLADRFPAGTEVFAEIRELGQWLTIDREQAEAAKASRGQDPMLQVLGQVWASQPVRPTDLPTVLAGQPFAVGLWKAGSEFQAAGLIELAPGQATQLEAFLKEHVKNATPAGEAGGVRLFKVTELAGNKHADFDEFFYGVSENWGVFATGLEPARAVLVPEGGRLSADADFRRTIARLHPDKGAILYAARGFFGRTLKELAPSKGGKAHSESDGAAPPSPEADAEPQVEGPPDAPAEPSFGLGKMGGEILKGLASPAQKLLALESVGPLGIWTGPPVQGEADGWRTRMWLGFGDPPKGLWRILAEGGARTPDSTGRLPRDGEIYLWGGGKDPAGLYKTAMDELQNALPSDQMGWIRAGIGAAEGRMGLSFSNDVLPTIGDEWSFVLGSAGPNSEKKRAAFLVSLRDARRLEDILTTKIASQFPIRREAYKGAGLWKWKSESDIGGDAPVLLVAGGYAVVTNDPEWALGTSQPAGKAYQEFVSLKGQATGRVVVDPVLWNQKASSLTVVTWKTRGDGLEAEARFPGEPLHLKANPDGPHPAVTEEVPGPAV
ncbi:MAG: hypothetical protein AB1347_09555 [Acidobacteriota bacterium]